VRTPVEGAEICEILRRRLFEDVGAEANYTVKLTWKREDKEAGKQVSGETQQA
jgi:hypothetical protein